MPKNSERPTDLAALRAQAEQAKAVVLPAIRRIRELVFALAGPAPGQPETLLLSDINSLFKVMQASADYLERYVDLLDAALSAQGGCINCGEKNQGGYDIEEVGSFCATCWDYLRQYFEASAQGGASAHCPVCISGRSLRDSIEAYRAETLHTHPDVAHVLGMLLDACE